MADFRTHVSFGIALGVLGVCGISATALSFGPGLLGMFFVAATLGSVLPDIDSDSGVPYHETFGSLSIIAAVLAFTEYARRGGLDWQGFLYSSFGAAFFVWVVIGTVFKRFTKHRGMAHSIPAVVLSGLLTFSLSSRFPFDDSEAFLIGLAVMTGYLSHLVLDEMFAAVNFEGLRYSPSNSLGSALKFFSRSLSVNVAVYGSILFLFFGNAARLTTCFLDIWERFSGRWSS